MDEAFKQKLSAPVHYTLLYDFDDDPYLVSLNHIRLLLKLDNQISGTIYWPFMAMNEACDLERVFTVKFHSKEAVQLFV